jgi:hypothetical protein
MKDILQILMMKLQHSQTPKYVGNLTHFFAFFIRKFGSKAYLDQLNQLQPGLGLVLLVQVWVPCLQAALPACLEAKTQIGVALPSSCVKPQLCSLIPMVNRSGHNYWHAQSR